MKMKTEMMKSLKVTETKGETENMRLQGRLVFLWEERVFADYLLLEIKSRTADSD